MADTIFEPAGQAVHERVASAVEAAIAEGRYRTGDKLPTHRALAQEFGVSIGSVTRAIESLSVRGIVRGEVGRGTFVETLPTFGDGQGPIDLSVNAPAPVISVEQMAAASALATTRALALTNGGYVDPAGTDQQRRVVADWQGRARDTVFDADALVLCNGAQQGLYLAMASLADRVGTVIMERAGFPGAIAAANSVGFKTRSVASDDEGPVAERLERLLTETGPALIYLTPVCQNPLGFEIGPERRAALAAVIAQHNAYIIEDDIYGLYARKGGPLFRDLLPERTFYVTSFSKSLTALVRLGVIAPPADFLPALRKRLRAESWGLPPYAVEMGVALIEGGVAERATSDLRHLAATRLALARNVLGIAHPPMPEGSPHVWLPLDALRAEQVVRRAGEAGVKLSSPAAMQVNEMPVDGVRVCLMAPERTATLERGLAIVARILAEKEEIVV